MTLLFCALTRASKEEVSEQRSYTHVLSLIQELIFVSLSSIQRGKEEYKPAPTSDGQAKKGKKGKGDKKDMDELKKEVDLVSTKQK